VLLDDETEDIYLLFAKKGLRKFNLKDLPINYDPDTDMENNLENWRNIESKSINWPQVEEQGTMGL
jgi:hypothetical protein